MSLVIPETFPIDIRALIQDARRFDVLYPVCPDTFAWDNRVTVDLSPREQWVLRCAVYKESGFKGGRFPILETDNFVAEDVGGRVIIQRLRFGRFSKAGLYRVLRRSLDGNKWDVDLSVGPIYASPEERMAAFVGEEHVE